MRNITATGNLYGEQITVQQISKAKAKKLFAQGETIYLQSSNMYPFGMWQNICAVKLDTERLQADINHNNFCIELYKKNINECINSTEEWRKNMLKDYQELLTTHETRVINASAASQFVSIINEYSYYNCDSERGKYVTFYTKISK